MTRIQYNNKKRPKQAIVDARMNHTDEPKSKRPWQLLLKLAIVAVVATLCVKYTDSKGFFLSDQQNRHHERRWESFYRMTNQDTIDVVIIGSSHAFCGINPKNLSEALGCNCFVMAFNASTTPDAYYVLKEVLTRTTPKIVIFETYNLRNLHNHDLEPSTLSNQFRSFYPRQNIPIKLASMPVLFTPENYLLAWSSTLRNHEILFKNPEEIKENIKIQKEKERPDTSLYLGRFVRFTSGITDSILHVYDSLGPAIDGSQMDVSDEEILYAQKIVDLCRSKNIQPIFLTIPSYYKNVKNAEIWTKNLNKAIEPTGAPWLNFQFPYDTLLFDRDCFESTRASNQHMTYYGSLVATYKLAHYIVDSLHVTLPDRSKDLHWHNMFYGEEGYFENYPARENDTTNILICKNLTKNGITIKDAMLQKGEDNNKLLVKVANNNSSDKTPNAKLRIMAKCNYQGREIVTWIDMYDTPPYRPIGHSLYSISLLKEVELLEILDLQWLP
ncbi:MAG: hypothetical protein IKQ75_04855 [Bacteroidales bacterium]|nr:hypothetical protein [Bacteroidales bacterium]